MEEEARTGPVEERTIGPRQPLPSYRMARKLLPRKVTAPSLEFEGQLLRFQLHIQQASRLSQLLAIIRSSFAQKFAAVSGECCSDARNAMLNRLQSEQSAELEVCRDHIVQEGEALVRGIAVPMKKKFRVAPQHKNGIHVIAPVRLRAKPIRRRYRRRRLHVAYRPMVKYDLQSLNQARRCRCCIGPHS